MPRADVTGSVTPARRSRDGNDDEEDTLAGDVDSVRSRGSKRPRLEYSDSGLDVEDSETGESVGEDEDTDDVEGTMEAETPPLPDNYRRSPTLQNDIGINGSGHNSGTGHQPGAIVRVTLKNFVTYTHVEFYPGPNLNMIIGPNGTGKSTLVCAICLGLGWSASHLARAKEAGAFVKHGAKEASITIELAADRARHRQNPVITCRIFRQNDKTKFSINGKESNRKQTQKLARSYNIQVDNLCQFLPQDRVTEFSALKPVDLLVQTLRAAAPDQMSEWHEALKALRKEEKKKLVDQQTMMDQLSMMNNKQKSQEGEVGRLRERTVLRERQAAMQKLRPFAEYKVARRIYQESKDRKRTAQSELQHLERQVEPNLLAASEKQQYLNRIQSTIQHRVRILERTEIDASKMLQKCEDVQAKIEHLGQEIDAERKSSREASSNIPRWQQEIQRIQRAIDTPPTSFDPAEINRHIREMGQRVRSLNDELDEVARQMHTLREQEQQRKELIEQCENEKQNLQSQVGRQTNKLEGASKDAAKAWKWIQDNRSKFARDVFGPPMVTCVVRDSRHADKVESFINRSELLAFTVTCQEDFRMLQQQLYKVLKLTDINIRSSIKPLSEFGAPCSLEELQRLGLESWLIDQIDGPEPVLAMLCDNRNIHRTGFTSRNLTPAQSDSIAHSAISHWVTASQINMVNRRREYGAEGSSSRVQRLNPAKLLTDAPIDAQVEQGIARRMNEARDELREMRDTLKELDAKQMELTGERNKIRGKQRELQEEKNQKQRQETEYNALPAKRERFEGKLEDARNQVNATKRAVMAKLEEGDRLCLAKAQHALDYARRLNVLRDLHEQLTEAEIISIEAKSDLEQLRSRHAEEIRLLDERRQEVEQLKQAQETAKKRGEELQAQCLSIEDLTEVEHQLRTETTLWETDRLEAEIETLGAQLDALHGGNYNIVRDFDKRAHEIERKNANLETLATALDQLHGEIREIQEKWEPELDRLVGRISEAFSENCSRIQCAGEVVVHKDEDFEAWAIHIKIKFRERDELSILTSKRQSGGERTVSTIFYLLALQSLARAPFRVVDEINQGMDPRNERLVHSRIVATACAEYTSQYFLITPKLLTGLEYHPKMKVHCIASGEHVPANHHELDFGALAQRALDIRTHRRAATAAG